MISLLKAHKWKKAKKSKNIKIRVSKLSKEEKEKEKNILWCKLSDYGIILEKMGIVRMTQSFDCVMFTW